MSASNLQVLMHAGELQYIVENIKKSDQNTKFVGGCLFGLWRNSLKQPVIQFVTGPDKNFAGKSVKEMIEGNYVKECTETLEKNHCLLRLGFWFASFHNDSGAWEQHVIKLFQRKRDPRYDDVLLFMNSSEGGKISGRYIISDTTVPLYQEDILVGHSSFRKHAHLTKEIKNNGSSFVSPVITKETISSGTNNLVDNLPSRFRTSHTQWYPTEEGAKLLQKLMQCFNSRNITPEISRDATTHDLQFNLNGEYALVFPPNFPDKLPDLFNKRGKKKALDRNEFHGGEEVCEGVVRLVVEKIRSRGW